MVWIKAARVRVCRSQTLRTSSHPPPPSSTTCPSPNNAITQKSKLILPHRVTDVSSTALRCNGIKGISTKCPVAAGDTVTVEMHAQPGDRNCKNVAIGGAHYGPVQVYMSKVVDASTADGSAGWFKVFADTWSAVCFVFRFDCLLLEAENRIRADTSETEIRSLFRRLR